LQPIGTYLYGRRIYETMAYWEEPIEKYPPEARDFARVWQKTEKIVFSRALSSAPGRNTRVAHDFDAEAIRALKRASNHDLAIAGAQLAGLAFEAKLVDECHLFLHPVVVGGGKPAFPLGVHANLDLVETRRFSTGVVHVHYRVR
jgi:dihydrofolate reductase